MDGEFSEVKWLVRMRVGLEYYFKGLMSVYSLFIGRVVRVLRCDFSDYGLFVSGLCGTSGLTTKWSFFGGSFCGLSDNVFFITLRWDRVFRFVFF